MHPLPSLRPVRPAALAGLAGLAILVTVLLTYGSDDALGRVRFTPARLSAPAAWAPCTVLDSSAVHPPSRCAPPLEPGTRTFRRLISAAHEARLQLQRDPSAEALQKAALLEMRMGDSFALDSAVSHLEQAHLRAPTDATVLNDLAAAYMAVGERNQKLLPMLHALNEVERALALDSLLLPALFNRALILERLYLVGSARLAWARYRRMERDPAWKAEADDHLRWLEQWDDRGSWGSLLTDPPSVIDDSIRAVIAAREARSPSAARDSSFRLFGRWGGAVLRGDTAGAARHLAVVREIARAAEARGADLSVGLALGTIDEAAADLIRLQALARAHVELATGYHLFYKAGYEAAIAALTTAERELRALGSPAAHWATFYRAGSERSLGQYETADSLFHRVIDSATEGESALVGKAIDALGSNQLRQGRYEHAISYYREALPHLIRAQDAEAEAKVSYLLSEALLFSGQMAVGYEEAYRGLRGLSPFRESGSLNNHLTIVALYASKTGLRHAAVALMDETLGVAHARNRPDVLAWAHRARARERYNAGQTAGAFADLQEAMRWVDSIPEGGGRDRPWADVMFVRAQMLRNQDPRAALEILSEVVEIYDSLGIIMHLPFYRFVAAQAAEAAGDRALARERLEEAIGEIERQQQSYHNVELRATHTETVENVFDAMIRLELQAGRSLSALQYLERGRLAAWAPDERPDSITSAIPAHLPADMLFVDYALMEDRLVVWTASRGSPWRHRTVDVPRDTLEALVDRFHREKSGAETRVGDVRARLFELLLRPIAGDLQGKSQLTVVPDRELSRLPFAALWDRGTSRYVVEDYTVRTLPHAAFFLSAATRGAPVISDTTALVIGNPTLEDELDAAFANLPGAQREARQVAGLYRTNRLLLGPDASRGTVLQNLGEFSVFHFAGHAVFNSERPELSYLALAPGDDASGILQAREIRGLRLSNLQVVVLSACTTLNPRPSRAGASAGLAYSFLLAGAPATISTAWDIDDRSTSEVLVEFHKQLRDGKPAAEALRQAQIAMLKSRSDLSAPAAWAAFIYTGP